MLGDLKAVRQRLLESELPEDICHDLLARIIFIEFLFQRKDSQGNAALNEDVLEKLHEKGLLLELHTDLSSILENREETYRFFRELNRRFNGDLFPGKGETEDEREKEWKAEMGKIKDEHLKLLAEFVRGQMDIAIGQRCLWPKYAFDAIPLEFISSIYEEFAKKKGSGVHYTPGHIVDLMLDEVLPWSSADWNLKILDPACGSGIFLVKAYQRLIHRWKRAHGRSKIRVNDLRDLLLSNLFGVDTNRDAVRVASFSLYLALCDEIDPKYVWQRNMRFPRLRGERLVESDFFAEDKEGFRTSADKGMYDLVIGNAPWGQDLVTDLAKQWANRDKKDIWPVQYKSPGPLFLIKAAYLSKEDGCVCMIQPAQALLTNRQAKAMAFRNKLFRTYKVQEVVNLSALRFGLFKDSISPSCVVKLCRRRPDEEPLTYICPKPTRSKEDEYLVVIEPHDISQIFWHEAATEPEVWSALMWGGRRDLILVRGLKQKDSLDKLRIAGRLKKREGIIRGDRNKTQEAILGRRILDTDFVPAEHLIFLRADKLRKNSDPATHSRDSTDLSAFDVPQLIIKQSWKSKGRFQSFLVVPDDARKGVLCSQSFVSVHADTEYESTLKCACLCFNSIIAVYYLFLTSGRCSGYIPEALVEQILSVPIPEHTVESVDEIESFEDVDRRVRDAFGFKPAEWVLVEDWFEYTLQDFKGGVTSRSRRSTRREDGQEEVRKGKAVLTEYCEYVAHVLRAGFGQGRRISATIFAEGDKPFLPVRLVAIHLETPGKHFIRVEPIDSSELIERLKELDAEFLEFLRSRNRRAEGGIFYQRVARVYGSMSIDGREVPTVFIVKPDQVRYWTRSMAMRDADEVSGDIMLWQEESGSK
jgi:hypothetical protein